MTDKLWPRVVRTMLVTVAALLAGGAVAYLGDSGLSVGMMTWARYAGLGLAIAVALVFCFLFVVPELFGPDGEIDTDRTV